ncbi:hypothetical protein SDC9_120964 [bioreactor metagenome]|uniref:Uncharacterized protein n=1 Tax=bioreactor metagenome TaxID=1076179 RepID=A0A645CAM3_9ZZZZ
MSEKYISASKLKAHYSWLGKDATLSPKDVDDIIDAQPAADVEPVVRGRWKTHIHTLFVFGTDNETYTYECGNCHCVEEEESIRCPHCGAHMMERSASGE